MKAKHGAWSEDRRPERVDADMDALDLDVSAGLGLIAHDLARALGAEITLLAVPGEALESVAALATWGAVPSRDGLPDSLPAGGFVGRALQFERAAVEPVDSDAAGLGVPRSGARITHVLAAPVEPLIGPAGVLCAAFSGGPPHDVTTALWLAESYARLAALCLQDRDALDGLLSGGRLDGLTRCLTQAAFLQELRRELARSERHGLASEPRHVPNRASRRIAETPDAASMQEVLEVAAQFHESGGASLELTAWELDTELENVVSAWSRAIKQGLLEPAGTDPASGEEMWRLSERGRDALDSPCDPGAT
ncbi:MAG TPA: hypothetical protein VIJ20_06730 [Solirubrobacteraceae bacterium]